MSNSQISAPISPVLRSRFKVACEYEKKKQKEVLVDLILRHVELVEKKHKIIARKT